jgi:hypothetical protein
MFLILGLNGICRIFSRRQRATTFISAIIATLSGDDFSSDEYLHTFSYLHKDD